MPGAWAASTGLQRCAHPLPPECGERRPRAIHDHVLRVTEQIEGFRERFSGILNVNRMPGLTWSFGYPLALEVMVLISVALYVAFKRVDWLDYIRGYLSYMLTLPDL